MHAPRTLFACAAVLWPLATAVCAEAPLPDPTRPAHFSEPAGAAASAAPRRGDAASMPAASAPQLQSVQLAPGGASTALVDGRVVRVGSRVGERTVLAIDEQGLLLRGARQDQRLTLLQGVTKLPSSAAPIAARPGLSVATTKDIP